MRQFSREIRDRRQTKKPPKDAYGGGAICVSFCFLLRHHRMQKLLRGNLALSRLTFVKSDYTAAAPVPAQKRQGEFFIPIPRQLQVFLFIFILMYFVQNYR